MERKGKYLNPHSKEGLTFDETRDWMRRFSVKFSNSQPEEFRTYNCHFDGDGKLKKFDHVEVSFPGTTYPWILYPEAIDTLKALVQSKEGKEECTNLKKET